MYIHRTTVFLLFFLCLLRRHTKRHRRARVYCAPPFGSRYAAWRTHTHTHTNEKKKLRWCFFFCEFLFQPSATLLLPCSFPSPLIPTLPPSSPFFSLSVSDYLSYLELTTAIRRCNGTTPSPPSPLSIVVLCVRVCFLPPSFSASQCIFITPLFVHSLHLFTAAVPSRISGRLFYFLSVCLVHWKGVVVTLWRVVRVGEQAP